MLRPKRKCFSRLAIVILNWKRFVAKNWWSRGSETDGRSWNESHAEDQIRSGPEAVGILTSCVYSEIRLALFIEPGVKHWSPVH